MGNGSLNELTRVEVVITGVVQGVGFRPFVYREAVARNLRGSVKNTSAGVSIDVEGPAAAIDGFVEAVRRKAPANSRITGMEVTGAAPAGFAAFEIGASVAGCGSRQLVSPDSCTCGDCLVELFDPGDRRYRYPFINCTNCGPRFTIIEGLPYDRPLTTMKKFAMCPECLAEYEDPADRRFHAEPNACPVCGPRLWLAGADGCEVRAGCGSAGEPGDNDLRDDDPIGAAAAQLLKGAIVALKGLGGFQLACLAADGAAVTRLRKRKARPDKPFAVMVSTTEEAAGICLISDEERLLLESVERPVILLERRREPVVGISDDVALRLGHLGVMLPCTPLHFLLMEAVGAPLVMTSGNLSNEPICRTNDEALSRLAGIADFFLLHDRGIRSTYDDSVVMVADGARVMIRRARGYAPLPVELPGDGPAPEPVLAAGAQLKNTFCLAHGSEAFVSQHIGDLEDADTLQHYENTVALYEELFNVKPVRFACDHHPDYLSTSYSMERTMAPIRVQHHRAHMASCLAENGFMEPAIGVILDGTGLGDDGRIWGGEFFTGSLGSGFNRVAHLEYMPLPGGEAAIREPWRLALGASWRFAPEKTDLVAERLKISDRQKNILLKQLWAGLNAPQTSSCGRLVDAVAAMVMERQTVSYEAQAAMELEAMATGWPALAGEAPEREYRFEIDSEKEPWVISPARVIRDVIDDLVSNITPASIAWRFHESLAKVIVEVCFRQARECSLGTVALSGGVFQNRLILKMVVDGLTGRGLGVLRHRRLPPNDGGVSYGQAALAVYNTSPLTGEA